MAQAKPMSISVTTLAAFTAIAELRSWAVLSSGSRTSPASYAAWTRHFCSRSSAHRRLPVYRLRMGAPHRDRSNGCFIEDVDLSFPIRYGMHPSETLVRAILDDTRLGLPAMSRRSVASNFSLGAASAPAGRRAGPWSANIQPVNNEPFVGLPSLGGHSIVSTSVTDHAAPALAMPLHAAGSSMPFGRVRASLILAPRQIASGSCRRPPPHLTDFPIGGRMACGGSSEVALACGPRRPLSPAEAPTGYGPSEMAALVRSLTVPQILAGAGGDVVRYLAEVPEFGETEPLLLAAVAIARSRLDVAESAIRRAEAEQARSAPKRQSCSISRS